MPLPLGEGVLHEGALSLALLLGSVNAACMNFRPPPRPLAAGRRAPPHRRQVWSHAGGTPFHRQTWRCWTSTLYGPERRSQGLRGGSRQRRGPVVAGLSGIVAGACSWRAIRSSRPARGPREGLRPRRAPPAQRFWRAKTGAVGAPLALLRRHARRPHAARRRPRHRRERRADPLAAEALACSRGRAARGRRAARWSSPPSTRSSASARRDGVVDPPRPDRRARSCRPGSSIGGCARGRHDRLAGRGARSGQPPASNWARAGRCPGARCPGRARATPSSSPPGAAPSTASCRRSLAAPSRWCGWTGRSHRR